MLNPITAKHGPTGREKPNTAETKNNAAACPITAPHLKTTKVLRRNCPDVFTVFFFVASMLSASVIDLTLLILLSTLGMFILQL
jgi:hypothetical protein